MDRRDADIDAGELVVRVGDDLLGPGMEHAQVERGLVGCDVDARHLSGRVARLAEARIDSLDSHHDPLRIAPDERVRRAVDDLVAGGVDRGEADQERARVGVRRRCPGERVQTGVEVRWSSCT